MKKAAKRCLAYLIVIEINVNVVICVSGSQQQSAQITQSVNRHNTAALKIQYFEQHWKQQKSLLAFITITSHYMGTIFRR